MSYTYNIEATVAFQPRPDHADPLAAAAELLQSHPWTEPLTPEADRAQYVADSLEAVLGQFASADSAVSRDDDGTVTINLHVTNCHSDPAQEAFELLGKAGATGEFEYWGEDEDDEGIWTIGEAFG